MGSCESLTMKSTSVVLLVLAFGGLVFGRPQELRCPNGDPFFENANSVDENGCTVGYCSKVCPTGAQTSDGRFVGFSGNKGPSGTGSNGNAAPVTNGLPVNPAEVSYRKQLENYVKWAEEQVKNAEKIAQT